MNDDVSEVQLQIRDTNVADQQPSSSMLKHYKWWLMVALCTFFILAGQAVGTLLGRLYFDHGGRSKWMSSLSQSAGSPLLLLPLLFSSPSTPTAKTASTYITIGLLIGFDNLMYSYGLLYLPVSTYALIGASQLAFSAVFSYFLNSQKLTSLILNSVVLLTFSAALLGVHADSDSSVSTSKGKYVLGFIWTIGASAIFSLNLSLMQLAFVKVLKKETFSIVLEMQMFTNVMASCVSVVGLFVSGEWRGIKGEMEEFKKGRVAYAMTLAWISIAWQFAAVGFVGLIFVVSPLFSNVVGTLGLPLVPIFAVIFFHDRMDGVKVMAMLIAIWGFLSYIYQQYLDDSRAKRVKKSYGKEVSMVPTAL